MLCLKVFKFLKCNNMGYAAVFGFLPQSEGLFSFGIMAAVGIVLIPTINFSPYSIFKKDTSLINNLKNKVEDHLVTYAENVPLRSNETRTTMIQEKYLPLTQNIPDNPLPISPKPKLTNEYLHQLYLDAFKYDYFENANNVFINLVYSMLFITKATLTESGYDYLREWFYFNPEVVTQYPRICHVLLHFLLEFTYNLI